MFWAQPFQSVGTPGTGCCKEVDHMSYNPDVVGSKPARCCYFHHICNVSLNMPFVEVQLYWFSLSKARGAMLTEHLKFALA